MSGPRLKTIRLRIKQADDKHLTVYDEGGMFAAKLSRHKNNNIRIVLAVAGLRQPVVTRVREERLSQEFVEKLLGECGGELKSCAGELARELWRAVEPWLSGEGDMLSDALEVLELVKETPLYEVEAGEGVSIEVVAADGVEIPIHGGYADLGEYKVIAETTYAHVKKTMTTRQGVVEQEGIEPITYVAVYKAGESGLELVERRVLHPTSVRKLMVGGRPVKFVAQSIASFELPTMANAAGEMRDFLEGATAPSFEELKPSIIEALKRYVSFEWDQRLYSLAASYVAYTYIYDLFTTAPRLFFLGPFGSGKTRAMLTIVYMSRHGWPVLSPSDASSYRSIEALGPTVGVDEAALTPGLKTILAAGYKRGLDVPRVEKAKNERFVLSLFKTFAPVVFAFTEPPSELLTQRTIIVTMKKAGDPSKRDPAPYDFEEIRGKLYLARLTRLPDVLAAMKHVHEDVTRGVKINEEELRLEARDYEIWYPVLVAARLLGEDVYKDVLALALEDIKERRASLWSEEKVVLAALERLYEQMNEDGEVFVRPNEILDEIRNIKEEEGEKFDEKEFARHWNTVKIGRIMARLGLKRRTNNKIPGKPKGYFVTLKEFCDIAARYGYESKICKNVPGQIGQIGHFFEKEGAESDTANAESETHNEAVCIKDYSTISGERSDAKNTTPFQKSDLSDLSDLAQSYSNLFQAILETLGVKGRMTLEELFNELTVLVEEEKLTVSRLTHDIVLEALKKLEEQGRVKRFYDERYGRVFYYVPQGW